ncbi:GNAT family N-acetyltransferase [Acerihabitans arboris]|uniref:GNAT family N-acetyltransferase n=1 Tax=Acerihabitans arboris TaxID=2691583 RepID=A0A845SPX3_9GAMM|nr:GNAT family N-acetyltransferase [Acerihabitans arboris]NDL63215.1 GNAT family N-acetyltransferase [Acerihabitans arboris]
MTLTIRPAEKRDSAIILAFVRELAEYEKALHEVKTNQQEIEKTLFGDCSRTEALICEWNAEPVGFAVFFTSYSTWLGRNGIYVEDLYVSQPYRGKGAGKALLKHIAQLAVARDCGRLEWSVLDWNQPAINFYDRLSAEPVPEWIRYRLEGASLQQIARRE